MQRLMRSFGKIPSRSTIAKNITRNIDPRNVYHSFITSLGYEPDPEDVASHKNEQFQKFPDIHSLDVPIQCISKSFHLTNFELSSTKVASDEDGATESLRCLWPFFRLSRLIGMCPITRQGNRLVVAGFCHPSWILTWIALIIQVIMVGNAVKQARKAVDTDELVKKVNLMIYYGHTLTNCLYMSWRIKDLPQFLVSCKRVEALCKKHQSRQKKPDGLVRQCFLLFLFFSISQAIGNALYFISVAHKEKATSVAQFFKSFNSEFIGRWGSFYSGIFFCFGELYCDMGWGFADILLALLSVVFGRFFTRLNCVLENKGATISLAKIEELRCDHREICHLVELCNDLFSPLILITYVANIGYLFTRLYTGLADDLRDPVITVRCESMYAFTFQILIKILTPSYLAARLHERAHEGLELIHSWPSTVIGPNSKYRLLVIGRFVSQLVTTQVGISGCGYFIISKSFIVTLVSALLTYEVIILQFQAANLKEPE